MKLIWLIVTFFGLLINGPFPPWVQTQTKLPHEKLVALMTYNFVPLEISGGKTAGVTVASAVVVGDDLVLTCSHVLEPKKDIYAFSRKFGLRLKVVAIDKKHDLMLLRFPIKIFRPNFKLARSMKVGERVFQYGNAFGLMGAYKELSVSGEYNSEIDFYFPTFIGGDSGSAIYNEYGEVVGLVKASFVDTEHAQGLGVAISADTIRDFLNKNLSAGANARK